MDIREQISIPVRRVDVWPLLSDPARVAACVPGVTLAPDQGDGMWRGSIRVRFGPTVATFRGEASVEYDHTAYQCSIQGRGIDQRGASRALSSGVIVATEDSGATTLTVDGSFTVTGPLEQFANAGGVHVARALLAEFAANMAALAANVATLAANMAALAAETSPAAPVAEPAPPPAPPPARELGGFGLLWRVLLSWLQSLFRGRTR